MKMKALNAKLQHTTRRLYTQQQNTEISYSYKSLIYINFSLFCFFYYSLTYTHAQREKSETWNNGFW